MDLYCLAILHFLAFGDIGERNFAKDNQRLQSGETDAQRTENANTMVTNLLCYDPMKTFVHWENLCKSFQFQH